MCYLNRLLFVILILSLCLPAMAQQTEINRYTFFTGFDYMVSPARNLNERGFEGDIGFTAKRWLGLGFDFGAMGDDLISGAGTINGSETVYAPLFIQYERLTPPPSAVNVPFRSTTYTFAAGPQFYIRHWEKVTFLVRPGLGGIHEDAKISFPPALVPLFQKLDVPLPSSSQADTEFFFGLGGGFDVNVSRRVGIRFTADWVNTHLFSNLLVPRQNYARFAFGPTWRWGHYC
jgi:opacity protein-like surface antigen